MKGVARALRKARKFYYKARRPYLVRVSAVFRVAEFYLNLAEAYNEAGTLYKALQNLNVVHNRAGLPSITETDKDKLRKIIQREWAVNSIMRTIAISI